MQKKIDFTNCKKVMRKAYNGANGKKIAIEYEGEQYMLKFPPSAKQKANTLSYSNSCYSEHIASSIFNMLGIPAQKTMLGTYVVNGKEKIVCACKDFTVDGNNLYDFCSIKNTVIDSEHGGTGTELEDMLETIEKQDFVNPKELREHFWNMFAADAFLGNFDRHNGNWGFIVDSNGNSEIAPIYDCGSCLLPQADEKIMKDILSSEEEMNSRIYVFPTSAIKHGDKKINYYDFLMKGEYPECTEALVRIGNRIDMKAICEFIDDTPYLTDLQREFYKKYLAERENKLILPSMEQVEQQEQEQGIQFS